MKKPLTLIFLLTAAFSLNVIAHDGHDHGNERVKEILEEKRSGRAEQNVGHAEHGSNHNMDHSEHMNHDMADMKTYSTKGVVQLINKETGMVMIKHEPVKELNWPTMSMEFLFSDKKVMDQVKEGDEIEFEFAQHGTNHVISSIKK